MTLMTPTILMTESREHELIVRCQHEHEAEPELSTEALCGLDELADKFEVARLIKMGVLKHEMVAPCQRNL